MNNEQSPHSYRGEIKKFIKNKGQVIASGAVLTGLSMLGIYDSLRDDSADDDYKQLGSVLYAGEVYDMAIEDYNSVLNRMNEEAMEETELLESQELILETPTPTNTPTTTPTPTATPVPYIPTPTPEVSSQGSQNSGKVLQEGESIWIVLADCETGDGTVGPPFFAQWDYNGPSGFDGGLQFHPNTWNQLNTGYEYAWQAPPDVQIAAAQRWLELTDWYQWPGCYAEMRAAGYLE